MNDKIKSKYIVPTLELDSNEFEEKVLISLDKTGYVRIVPKVLYNRIKELNRFTFALMNTFSSKRKHCPACRGKHRYFIKSSDIDIKEDETGLCDSCGVFLENMGFFGVPKDKLKEWIISEGEVDPYDLMRDAIQEGIKRGDIKIQETPFKDFGERDKGEGGK